jgi:hypothetical protein
MLFSASNDRIASFSAQEWGNWFKVLTKVPAIVCQLRSLFILFFFLQIVDHPNTFQLPDAMKVMAAFIRSAQELLFDASSGVAADEVLQNISKIGKTWFDILGSVQNVLFPIVLTSSYFCVLIELPEACFLQMKTECLLFTESWTFVANALISAKHVSLQKYPSLLSLFAYRLKCHRTSISH